MNIPLNEFEDVINEVILERGLSYFEGGFVVDFLELSDGEFEFTVLGTTEYIVNLTIEEGVIVDYDCNCPYSRGPVCKHVVASIFYLKQEELVLTQQNKQLPGKKKKRKETKSLSEQVKEILDKSSHDDLKKFIQDQCKANKQFRNLFLSNFTHLNQNLSKTCQKSFIKNN